VVIEHRIDYADAPFFLTFNELTWSDLNAQLPICPAKEQGRPTTIIP